MARGKKVNQTLNQVSPKFMETWRGKVNHFWIPLDRKNMPPHDTMVLIKVGICHGMSRTYTGKFRYDVEDCVQLGGTSTPIPLNKAKHHGIVAWMPIPN